MGQCCRKTAPRTGCGTWVSLSPIQPVEETKETDTPPADWQAYTCLTPVPQAWPSRSSSLPLSLHWHHSFLGSPWTVSLSKGSRGAADGEGGVGVLPLRAERRKWVCSGSPPASPVHLCTCSNTGRPHRASATPAGTTSSSEVFLEP